MDDVNVHFLPAHVEAASLAGSTCVVIDVLRATTTVAQALACGASNVIPCTGVSEAMAIAATLPRSSYILGGERGGRRIDGFDLGNSPREYQSETTAGKTIIFTTTNGTRAMHHCRFAAEVLLGAIVNMREVGKVLARRGRIDVVCAGTDGAISLDDVLGAGLLIANLPVEKETNFNDEAIIALETWTSTVFHDDDNADLIRSNLVPFLERSRGGRNLIELGLREDIVFAAEYASLEIVPCFRNGRITRLSDEVRAPQ